MASSTEPLAPKAPALIGAGSPSSSSLFQNGQDSTQASVIQETKSPYIKFLDDYKIGDHLGIVGLVIGVYGTWLGYKSWKAADAAKSAAVQAKIAAEQALHQKSRLDAATALSDIAQRISEIKKLHLNKEWGSLSERYSTSVEMLAQVHISDFKIRETVDIWITQLNGLEKKCMETIHKDRTAKALATAYTEPLSDIIVAIRRMTNDIKSYKED